MTQDEFVDNIRQEIREDGFMSAMKLSATIFYRAKEFEIEVDLEKVMSAILCEDIHVTEYTNWLTQNYRRKDLYFFLPKEST